MSSLERSILVKILQAGLSHVTDEGLLSVTALVELDPDEVATITALQQVAEATRG